VALIIVDHQGENLIAVAPGANFSITPEEVERAADRIRSADVVLLQLEIPMKTVEFTAALAARSGVPVVLDPAPAAPLAASLIKHVHYLTPNETEAERLTGVAVRDQQSAHQSAQMLLAKGAQCVILTMGTQGALVAESDRTLMVPSYRVDALDSTAAGDAFNGGLAVGLAKKLPLEEAVRQACLVGALSVTRVGAQPSLPTEEDVRQFAAG
jgi:ribokinase